MIDFHSHVLPFIDDGSKSVEESLGMLSLLKEQGVSTVVATPHFYANHNSVDDFINKRDASFNKIFNLLSNDMPDVILGAEVKYYPGISRLDNIQKLCIGDSKLLLLEMPMSKWTEYILREVRELSFSGKVKIVLAHIDRYLSFQNIDTIASLVEDGVLIQANADFFINFMSRRKAMRMLKSRLIHFIGSDCHNLDSRPPNIDIALSYIKRKNSEDIILKFDSDFKRFIL